MARNPRQFGTYTIKGRYPSPCPGHEQASPVPTNFPRRNGGPPSIAPAYLWIEAERRDGLGDQIILAWKNATKIESQTILLDATDHRWPADSQRLG